MFILIKCHMVLYTHYFHIIFVTLFSLYIFIDRLIIRTLFKQESREVFYKNSRIPIIIITLGIVISGIVLAIYSKFEYMLILKIVFATALIYGFFNCPFFMKKQDCEMKKFMYRFGVVVLLICTIIIGINI